ncbi:hypothetical protein BDW02DRAFT_601861 [Decorospora gaudefroyi]|uniref:Uncharacterized protein n=1 Tax=Decorospora gaudefroyi TaxID=184978 RepID=A0A6A5K060_9PLEO|nr:hypothetical protein BDW02DRAFT_601861 [Decorospora gaudefroyi]
MPTGGASELQVQLGGTSRDQKKTIFAVADDEPMMCTPIPQTKSVDDGSNTKWTYWKQISYNLHCGSGSCTVGYQQSESYTITFGATAKLNEWISASLSVARTTTTGNSYSCNGGSGETVCVWAGTHHWEYSAKNTWKPADPRCGQGSESPNIRMWSPIEGHKGVHYWCGHNSECNDKGADYWKPDWWTE